MQKWKSAEKITHHQAIQEVGDFVSSSEQI